MVSGGGMLGVEKGGRGGGEIRFVVYTARRMGAIMVEAREGGNLLELINKSGHTICLKMRGTWKAHGPVSVCACV